MMRYFFNFLVAGFLICNYGISNAQLGYLEFISSPNQGIAGEYIPFIIQRKDINNNIMIDGTTTINLSGFGTFTPNPVIIEDGTSSAEFYYYQEKAGSWTITASCGSITVNTSILIEPEEVHHLTFITFPATITVKTISPAFIVQRQDKFDNPVTKGTLSITGLSRPGSGTFLPTDITISDGTSIAKFYYYDSFCGSPTIKISAVVVNQAITPAWATIQVLSPPPYVKFIAENIPTEYQYPGRTDIMILKIFVENLYLSTKTITSIKLTNATKGSGSQSDLDSQISKLSIYHNSTLLGSTTFISGTATFDNLYISIPPWGLTTLSIFYDLSIKNAKDGDIIDIQVEDVSFATTTTINANFPLNSYGHHIVDGMVSSQILINHILSNNFKSGELNKLVLDIVIPPNGYAEDTLNSLSVENAGSADENDVILKLWVDNLCLGTMNWTGAMWQKTGLNQLIGTSGLRIYIKADIKDTAYEGKTIKLRLPIKGIEVLSNNDGPIDNYIENYYSQQIKVHNKVIFEVLDLLKEKVSPNDKNMEILRLAVTNYYPMDTKTLSSIIITNTSEGSGTTHQLDSQIDTLYLYDGINTIGISNYKDGKAIFSGLNLEIAPEKVKELKVKYDISLHNAKDGNIIDCSIKEATDINFKSGTTSIGGIFPLNSSGFHKIDGLVNPQITNYGANGCTVATGTTNVLVLDVVIPSNGYATDTLTKMRVKNSGTARDLRDIKSVRLEVEPNTATFYWNKDQEYWEWVGTISIPYPGKRILIKVDVADEAINGATIVMKIPVNGLEFLSDNDGPIDSEVINPYVQTISHGLLSSLKLVSPKVEVGGSISVIMEVVNTSTEDVHTLTPTTLILEGSGSATLMISAPGYIPILPAGSSTKFTWTYKVSDYPGTLTFNGYATSTTLSSIPTYSEPLYIQDIPKELVITHIPRMPFEINKGQTNIVPMSIIFKNPATATFTGDIAIGTLTFNLGTIPNQAIAGIIVSRAGIIYGSKTNIETSGTITILSLKTPIIIPPSQTIAINLIIDIPTSTTTDKFQISLREDGILAYDVNSHQNTKISGNFPLNSGYSWIKAPSKGIIVGLNNDAVPKYVNIAQENVLATQIELIGDSNTSKVEITKLSLTLSSTNTISKIIIKDDDVIYGEKELRSQQFVDIDLLTPIIIYNFKKIDVRINIASQISTSTFNIGSLSVSARDYNTKELLTVTPGTVTSSKLITIQSKAQQAMVIATSTIPTKIYPGQQEVNVFNLTINHSGTTTNTANILLKEVTLHIPQSVSKIIIEPGAGTYFVSGTQNLTLTNPVTITPKSPVMVNLKIDISPSANLGEFKIELLDLKFIDANDFSLVTDTFLPISATSQIKEKPKGVLVSFKSNMPVNVAKGDKNISALTLTFTNQGGTETDEINVGTITISISDKAGNPISANRVLSKIILSYDATQTIETNISADSNITIRLVPVLKVSVDRSKDIEIKVDISKLADVGNFRINLISVMGFDNWANPVNISGDFPMASQSAVIISPALETSFTNYPNPFEAGREYTTIAYYLPEDGYVTIKIYTISGDLVITLLDNIFKSKGMHQEDRWDGRNGIGEVVLNGVYFCQIKVNYNNGTSDKKVRKIAVIR